MEIPASRILGMLAGLLILLVGFFVYKANPRSPIHRLFFAFATADGVSTFFFDLAATPGYAELQMHAYLFYFHGAIAFFGLIVIFGLLFPRPLVSARFQKPLVLSAGGATLGLVAWHALSPETFWTARRVPDGLAFSYAPLGLLVVAATAGAVAALLGRLTLLMRTESSPSHRRQAAFVFGGMALAYTPYATTTLVAGLRAGLPEIVAASLWPFHVGALYGSLGLVVVSILVAATLLLSTRDPEFQSDRHIVLWCLAGVAGLTLAAIVLQGRVTIDLLQILGLLAYPCLLAYAIARYEILDIGPTVRRTALISFVTSVLAATFFIAEAILQVFLEARFSGALGVPMIAAIVAGVTTLAVVGPLAKLSQTFTRRIAPDLTDTTRRDRQIEIYRHGLEAAIVDGTVDPREQRVLASLRTTLGLTIDDHEKLLTEISRRRSRAA